MTALFVGRWELRLRLMPSDTWYPKRDRLVAPRTY